MPPVQFSSDSKSDLAGIGGSARDNLVRELLRLDDAERDGHTREVPRREPGKPQRRSWSVGNYTAVFFHSTDPRGEPVGAD